MNSAKKAATYARCSFGAIGFVPVLLFLVAVLSGCGEGGSKSTASKSFAPKEYNLIFVSDTEGNQEISILDLSSGAIRNLTNSKSSDVSPSWWPTRRRIIFGSSRTGQGDIYTMKPDGSDQTILIGGPNTQQNPMVSPDGKKLVYVEFDSNKPNIIVRDLETGTDFTVGNGLNPAWSPDSRRISFDGPPSGGPGWLKEVIFIVDALESSPKPEMLIHGSQDVHGYIESYWHPDGKSLLYVTGFGANRWLYLQDLSAKTGTTVSEGLGHDRYPSITPDGKYIACVSNLSDPSVGGFLEKMLPSSRSWGLVVIQMADLGREKVITSGVSLDRPVWVKTADIQGAE